MSFKDTFSRDEKKDEVEYDSAASYTFGASILLVIIVPLVYKIFSRIFFKIEVKNTKKYINCECKNCSTRLEDYFKLQKKSKLNKSFYFMVFLVFLLSYFLYNCYTKIIENNDKIKSFSPWDILEIEATADDKTIKKAYRRLSLRFHPDKNPNNLQAKAKFIMITKAYESLTDPISKENFAKYGNPDGPGSMKLGVALPSFILDKKNHIPILVLFLIFVVVLIPGVFSFWYNNSMKYDDMGLHMESWIKYRELLNENVLHKHMPYILGVSDEFQFMTLNQDEYEELNKMYKANNDSLPKPNLPFCQYEHLNNANKKAICLLYSYLKKEKMSENLQKDLNRMLSIAPEILDKMFILVWRLQMDAIHRPQDTPNLKNFGVNCMRTVIEFSQMIHQQLWLKASPFLQIPHFDDAKIKDLSKKNHKLFTSIKQFLKLTPDQRKEVLSPRFSDDELKDVEIACKSLPLFDIKVEAFVDGYDEFIMGDLVSFKLTFNRLNFDKDKKLGILHSNRYPSLFEEKIYIILRVGEKLLLDLAIINIEKPETIHEFRHGLPQPGKFTLSFEILYFNYKGFDETINYEINVLHSSEKRNEFVKAIEKREPKKLEPSLFQQMLSNVFPYQYEESDEDEEEEKKDGEGKKNKTEKEPEVHNEEEGCCSNHE